MVDKPALDSLFAIDRIRNRAAHAKHLASFEKSLVTSEGKTYDLNAEHEKFKQHAKIAFKALWTKLQEYFDAIR